MTLSLKENINICFTNNENANYKKSYTFCFILKIALTGNYNSAKGG